MVQWQNDGCCYLREGAAWDNTVGTGMRKDCWGGSEARLESSGRKCSGTCLYCCPQWLSLEVTTCLGWVVNTLGMKDETGSVSQVQLLFWGSEDQQS